MGVTYDLIDAPYPYLCAVYRCRCGATVTRHGDEAGAPPPGWHVDVAEAGESAECVCAHCADQMAATDMQPAVDGPAETP